MLITKEWSEPKQVKYGDNIVVRSSQGNFNYEIYSSNGKSVEGIIHQRLHTINVDDELIRLIRFPMISFRNNTSLELHINFETLSCENLT